MSPAVPAGRIRLANDRPVHPGGDYVLLWMIAARRAAWNFALDRAVDHARALRKPLVVFEPIEVDYPWASDRLHRFVIDGMRDNAAAFRGTPVTYFPYVEPEPGAGRGLLQALASSAAVVVTDDFPCFFLPRMVAAAAARLDVRVEAIDGNGLLPMRAAARAYPSAALFRRFMQKTLADHLSVLPRSAPLGEIRLEHLARLPRGVQTRWPAASEALLNGNPRALARLPIDHGVAPVAMRGGPTGAATALDAFIDRKLAKYGDLHNEPEVDGTSGFSPYLHFGHLSAHEIFARVMRRERWTRRKVADKPATGAREGWWGVSPSSEQFLDQLVVWRELGYNMCALRPDEFDQYQSLPPWAQQTLAKHGRDRRPHLYDFDTLERGETADPLWNAAQGQLRAEGWMHNYMRMLWGKKILEWSKTPQQALERMIAIMNRWALDGRNPNSYSGYFWTLGRYDRPWPERDVFGVVRYMSSVNTARKISTKRYVATFAPSSSQNNLPLT